MEAVYEDECRRVVSCSIMMNGSTSFGFIPQWREIVPSNGLRLNSRRSGASVRPDKSETLY